MSALLLVACWGVMALMGVYFITDGEYPAALLRRLWEWATTRECEACVQAQSARVGGCLCAAYAPLRPEPECPHCHGIGRTRR